MVSAAQIPSIEAAALNVKSATNQNLRTSSAPNFINSTTQGVGMRKESSNWKGTIKLRCDHCQKVGHTINRCYEIVGYSTDWQVMGRNLSKEHSKSNVMAYYAINNALNSTSGSLTASIGSSTSSSSPINGLTQEEYTQLLSLLNMDKSNSVFCW